MKGITPVIAIILLLLITISMVGFAFVWFNRISQTLTNATQSELESQLSQQAKKVSIINPRAGSPGAIDVRNTGTATILSTDASVYIAGNRTVAGAAGCGNPVMPTVGPGSVATITCNCAIGDEIKVVVPGNTDIRKCA